MRHGANGESIPVCLPQRTVVDRFEVIRPYVEGVEVLDLGVVDSRPAKGPTRERLKREANLLFRRISEINPNVLGVDVDAEGVAALVEEGYRVECADVQTMDIGRRFDTIVGGEIIEHLEDPGRFLRNMRRHLKREGTLILSTPNPFYVKQRWKIWRSGRPRVHAGHTCWFDPLTLDHLLRRTGFEPFDAYWAQPKAPFLKTWSRLLRAYFSHSFIVLSRPANEG